MDNKHIKNLDVGAYTDVHDTVRGKFDFHQPLISNLMENIVDFDQNTCEMMISLGAGKIIKYI